MSTLGYAVAVLSVYSASVAVHFRHEYSLSSENVLLKNEFPKSIPAFDNVDLESQVKSANSLLEVTSDIFNSLSMDNQNSYHHKNRLFNKIHQSKSHKTDVPDTKRHALVEYIRSSPPSLNEKTKCSSCIHSNFFLRKVVNNSFYELQWWPSGFNNACISILVK